MHEIVIYGVGSALIADVEDNGETSRCSHRRRHQKS